MGTSSATLDPILAQGLLGALFLLACGVCIYLFRERERDKKLCDAEFKAASESLQKAREEHNKQLFAVQQEHSASALEREIQREKAHQEELRKIHEQYQRTVEALQTARVEDAQELANRAERAADQMREGVKMLTEVVDSLTSPTPTPPPRRVK